MSGRRAITLVARREIRERLRSKAFLVSTLVMSLLVGRLGRARATLERSRRIDSPSRRPRPRASPPRSQRAAEPFDDAKVQLRMVAIGRRRAAASSRPSDVDALLLLSTDRLVFRKNVDVQAAAVADTAIRALRNQLPPAARADDGRRSIRRTTSPTTLRRSSRMPAPCSCSCRSPSTASGYISGVVEEKNNRVVEMILSTVRPRHLLAGKVIGIGLLGLAQLVLVAGLAAGLLVGGVFDAPAALGGSVALVVPWFVLGFALYAVAYAAAGALASSSRTRTRLGSPSRTRCSPCTSPATSSLAADSEGRSQTSSPSSR